MKWRSQHGPLCWDRFFAAGEIYTLAVLLRINRDIAGITTEVGTILSLDDLEAVRNTFDGWCVISLPLR